MRRLHAIGWKWEAFTPIAKPRFADIGRLVDYFGPTKFLADITDDDVARMVQWRRSHRKNGRDRDRHGQPTAHLTPATVNRSTTEVLKKLFTRAKRTWKQQYPNEPNWADHMMKEPTERVRELQKTEGAALRLATRADYAPILAFAGMTGLRLQECLLKWSSVDFGASRITTIGKGGKLVTTSITPAVRAILEPLVSDNSTWVFTFKAERTRDGRTAGKRYPITYYGLVSQWRRIRAKADVPTFRFHDFRHDVGTKLLRATGNLKLVQQALNHSDIKTTTRYAHVLDSEVASAMQKLAEAQSDKKSRRKSRRGVANA